MRPRIYAGELLQSAAEAREPWTMPADVAELDAETFFARAFRMQPPAPVEPSRPVPVRRSWAPDPGTPIQASNALRLRHPALDWALTEVPERNLPRSPRGSSRGFQNRVPTLKGIPRTMRCASNVEADALLACEYAPEVLRFVEQPFVLRYPHAGKRRWYRPDVLLQSSASLIVWEVKYELQAAAEEERWEAIGRTLVELGLGFEVVTERHVTTSQEAETIAALHRDRHAVRPSDDVLGEISKYLTGRPVASVADLVAGWPTLEPRHVHALVRRHFLRAVRLDVPLGPDFEVCRGKGYAVWDCPEVQP